VALTDTTQMSQFKHALILLWCLIIFPRQLKMSDVVYFVHVL